MHDRMFRATTNPYVDSLMSFVSKCKEKGYRFDVLENYKPQDNALRHGGCIAMDSGQHMGLPAPASTP
jgi:hypothetical protein